ncbi:MAG: glycosyltransferase family 4 protein [Chloroflexota bacterium]|nr:glycosyltransferase family 4 protein [Chloroflexota bacterium]
MKRIVRLINLYPPYVVGGNEMLNRDIVDALRARGYDVHVLTAHGRALEEVPHVHQVFNYDLDEQMEDLFQGGRRLSLMAHFRHHLFDPVTYHNTRRAAKQLNPDLVVAGNLYMASAAPLLAVRDLPCPIVAEVADKWLLFNLVDWGMVVKPRTSWQRLIVRGVQAFFQRRMARRARLNGIATVSNFIRELYTQAGFAPEELETTYLGIHEEVFKPGPPHPLNDPVQLVFIGSLWKGKGPQVIIRAMNLLNGMGGMPSFQLDLFGEGSDRFKRYLRKEIEKAGVENQVTFRGFVPWERLVETMHRADMFVFSSIWDEPFAITPLQAMGCGLPVVATRAGGTPEGFVDGETALLIPPDDAEAMAKAVVRLVRDESLRKSLRENGLREAQERWSFDAYVERLLDFYRRAEKRWRKARLSEE